MRKDLFAKKVEKGEDSIARFNSVLAKFKNYLYKKSKKESRVALLPAITYNLIDRTIRQLIETLEVLYNYSKEEARTNCIAFSLFSYIDKLLETTI